MPWAWNLGAKQRLLEPRRRAAGWWWRFRWAGAKGSAVHHPSLFWSALISSQPEPLNISPWTPASAKALPPLCGLLWPSERILWHLAICSESQYKRHWVGVNFSGINVHWNRLATPAALYRLSGAIGFWPSSIKKQPRRAALGCLFGLAVYSTMPRTVSLDANPHWASFHHYTAIIKTDLRLGRQQKFIERLLNIVPSMDVADRYDLLMRQVIEAFRK